MATAYTPILQLALPVTGELQGTWGTVVNDNITSMIEQAIAGLATINTWTTASHTLTTANGTTSEARCAVLECSGAPGAAATVICPASTKLYVIKNSVTGGFAVTLKTSAGTGISVPNGSTALLYCDGTNVVSGATYMATVSTTQVDILAQGDLRLQDSTGGEYVALQAPATIATSYTLTLPVDDGTAGQALITDGSGVLSWSTAASGDVYGPASATDNAVARYDGTTGKIIQNSAVTIADDGATVIAANSASDGLRITQLGAGNALVVEDETNPDATSTVITAAGAVRVGSSTSYNTVYGASQFAPGFQLYNTAGTGGFYRYAADTDGAALVFAKSRNATVGSQTVVNSSDTLGYLGFAGSDGTNFTTAATITGAVDGTPGTGDMPGRLTFNTTADGASTPTERMRIDSAGKVGIGGTAGATNRVRLVGTSTGNTTQYGFINELAAASDVTGSSTGFTTSLSTAAAAFTLSELRHFSASFTTVGAGSTITTQYGFYASSALTGATNNYGFYGAIASGANRYNFYAAGTASNYFGGNTIVEVTDNTNAALRITQLGTGNALLVEDSTNPDATPTVIDNSGRVLVGVDASRTLSPSYIPNLQIEGTTFVASSQSITLNINTAASPTLWFAKSRGATNGSNTIVSANDALGVISFNGADGTDIQSIAAQITASVDGTPGADDMPGRLVFSTTADGASSPTEALRISSAQTVSIGGSGTVSTAFYNRKNITGAVTAYANFTVGQVQSDVTSAAYGYRTSLSTAATAYTLGELTHYRSTQSTIGAGSTVTNQFGFLADSSLIGATNNYGFYGNIPAGTGDWNFYAAGTAANYFAGDMQLDKTVTAGGTTGAQTINKNAGTVNFAAAATSLVVTDSRVTTSSIIICTVGTNDTTLKSVAAVAGAGSFTLHASAAATAETRVNFLIIN